MLGVSIFIEQLIRSIDGRLELLRGEVDRLTDARAELARNGARSAATTSRPARKPAKRRRRRAAPARPAVAVVPAGKLHRLLAESGDLSTAELSERASADPAQVLALLREMESAGRVRRTGQRRGTRWHAVNSEEEWIAQRAAELAGRSGA